MTMQVTAPNIKLTGKVERMCHALVDRATGECSLLGLVKEERDASGKIQSLIIDEVFVPKQENSSGSTEMDEDSLADYIMSLADRNNGDEGRVLAWIHSHVNMGVFWSGTDTSNIAALLKLSNKYLISIVYNKKHEYRCRLDVVGGLVPFIVDNTTYEITEPTGNLCFDYTSEIVELDGYSYECVRTKGDVFADWADQVLKERETIPKHTPPTYNGAYHALNAPWRHDDSKKNDESYGSYGSYGNRRNTEKEGYSSYAGGYGPYADEDVFGYGIKLAGQHDTGNRSGDSRINQGVYQPQSHWYNKPKEEAGKWWESEFKVSPKDSIAPVSIDSKSDYQNWVASKGHHGGGRTIASSVLVSKEIMNALKSSDYSDFESVLAAVPELQKDRTDVEVLCCMITYGLLDPDDMTEILGRMSVKGSWMQLLPDRGMFEMAQQILADEKKEIEDGAKRLQIKQETLLEGNEIEARLHINRQLELDNASKHYGAKNKDDLLAPLDPIEKQMIAEVEKYDRSARVLHRTAVRDVDAADLDLYHQLHPQDSVTELDPVELEAFRFMHRFGRD